MDECYKLALTNNRWINRRADYGAHLLIERCEDASKKIDIKELSKTKLRFNILFKQGAIHIKLYFTRAVYYDEESKKKNNTKSIFSILADRRERLVH